MTEKSTNGTTAANKATRHTIRTVSLGTFWRILRYPFILLSVAIIPRMMGDETYGRYAFFMSIYLIFEHLTSIGMTQVFGRLVPEYKSKCQHDKSAYLFHGFLFYSMLLTLTVVLCLGIVSVAFRFESFPHHWFLIMGGILLFGQLEGVLFAFIYGLNHIARYSSREAMRSAFTFTLVLILYWRFGLTGALCGLVLNELVLTLIGMAWTKSYLFSRWTAIRFTEFKPYLLLGVKFYVPFCLFGVMQRSGNVFVQWLTCSSKEVAYFDVANQFLLLTATFFGLILYSLLPSLTVLHTKGLNHTIYEYQRTAVDYCCVAVFFAYNALGWLGRDVISGLLGPSFAPVFANALIMVAAIFPGLVSYIGINYSILYKEPSTYARAVLSGLIVMAFASCIFIPRWNSRGAAVAAVLGHATMAVVFLRKYRHEFRDVLKDFPWIAIIGLCFLPFYYFKFSLLLSLVLYFGSSLLYFCVLLSLKLISWSDARRIVHAFQARNSGSPGEDFPDRSNRL